MLQKGKKAERIVYWAFLGIIVLFCLGFVWINLNPEQWYNYDIYADAMVAKHMLRDRSLFPSDWTFGNQLYVGATPVVAALFYGFCKDTVLSLGLASCVMTLLTALSFLWCLGPFAGRKGKLMGLLCLMGGTIFGGTASSDPKGLQVFYTMASYYSCYMVGILLTLGLWLRLLYGKKPSGWVVVMILGGNLLLSMQSLRELLVLNLPLCATAVLLYLPKWSRESKTEQKKGNLFAFAALGAGLGGVLLIKVLERLLPIHQIDVLADPQGGLVDRCLHNLRVLAEYMGLQKPTDLLSLCKLLSGLFCLTVAVLCTADFLKRKERSALGALLIFAWLSVGAVFCAGVLVISTRHIYYFPWVLVVVFSMAYVGERLFLKQWRRWVILLPLLGISLSSLYFNYRLDIGRFRNREENCRATAQQLLDRGITHVYYDGQWNFYGPQIAAYSHDRILMPAYFLNPGGWEQGDLLKHTDYLSSDSWYDLGSLDSSYLLLSEKTLAAMDEAYKEALLSHLELQMQCTHLDVEFYFYSFDEALFCDLNNER